MTHTSLAQVQQLQTQMAPAADVSYANLFAEMKKNYQTQKTFQYEWRIAQLKALRNAITENEQAIVDSLYKDMRKPHTEVLLGETGATVCEIDYAVENLHKWMESEKVDSSLVTGTGSFEIVKQPKGVSLIIGAWNYPFFLAFGPLIGAIAAGCPCVIKPSEVSPASAVVIETLVKKYLDGDFFRVVQGAVVETTALLKEPFAHIFYTGNGFVGKVVARAAAEHLASYTLELGGKSPVYVSDDAPLEVAAQRIVSTKFFNNGQTCVAPDYVLVDGRVKEQFTEQLKRAVVDFYGANAGKSQDLARVVNSRHFGRLASILKEKHEGSILTGGLEGANESDLFIPPTIVLDPKLDSKMMHEEIFGPILPVIFVKNGLTEALSIINAREASLASYIYTKNSKLMTQFVNDTQSGGTGVNECAFHLLNPNVPFGGISSSGNGMYHGKFGFDAFTHFRTVMKQSVLLNPRQRFPPYDNRLISIIRYVVHGQPLPAFLKAVGKVAVVAIIFAVAQRLIQKLARD